jgi:hypothetical protein
MSLYRFVRTSTLLMVAGRYRSKLFRIAVAIGVALVTSWLFDDIALYLESQRPEWLGPALIIKTLVVYGALVYGFWQLRPGSWAEAKADAIAAEAPRKTTSGSDQAPESPPPRIRGPLDELVDKPKLRSRKDAILESDSKNRS